MAVEFQVKNVEEFEHMIQNMDFRVSEALVSTILKNLKGKRKYLHAFSVISEDDGDIYDITINRQDFKKTLTEALPKYEKEEKYEECVEITEAIKYLQNKNDK
jgi:cytidylate kinase